MQLSPRVRFALRILAVMGGFITVVGLLMLVREPHKYSQWLTMLLGDLWVLGLIRQVRHGEGQWLDRIEVRKRRRR